jgi:hypothetical protein
VPHVRTSVRGTKMTGAALRSPLIYRPTNHFASFVKFDLQPLEWGLYEDTHLRTSYQPQRTRSIFHRHRLAQRNRRRHSALASQSNSSLVCPRQPHGVAHSSSGSDTPCLRWPGSGAISRQGTANHSPRRYSIDRPARTPLARRRAGKNHDPPGHARNRRTRQ